MKFYGKVENGELRPHLADYFNQFLQKLEGQEVEISVRKKTKMRSSNQNAYYWGVVVKMISDETGYSPSEVHELLLANAFGFEERKIGGMLIRIPIKRSSELTTSEFEYLASKSRELASIELGLFIPKPHEVMEF